jgi:hypothetical protein
MLTVVAAVYGWYFIAIFGEVNSGAAVTSIPYQGAMLWTVLAVIVLAIAGTVIVTIASRGDAGSDERDREINRFGEYIGGYVLSVGALAALALAMMEAEHFWIANTILLTLVVSELVSGFTKALSYRKGF